jgi:mRNA interferase HigB
MHVITHARVVAAQAPFPESARALDFWYRAMKRGRFATFAELRAAFTTRWRAWRTIWAT